MKTLRFALASLSFCLPIAALAQVQSSITIQQLSPLTTGVWTFVYGDGTATDSYGDVADKNNHSFSVTNFGPMTLSIRPPAGMTLTILVYRNDEFVSEVSLPQYSFTPYPNERYRFVVKYSYSLLGNLGITSDPSGARFRMSGPTRRVYSGKTPFSFSDLPAGKYTLYFGSTAECSRPAPVKAIVEAQSRNTAHVSLPCDVVEDTTIIPRALSRRSIVEAAKARELKPRGERK